MQGIYFVFFSSNGIERTNKFVEDFSKRRADILSRIKTNDSGARREVIPHQFIHLYIEECRKEWNEELMMMAGGIPSELTAIKKMSCEDYLTKLSIFVGTTAK